MIISHFSSRTNAYATREVTTWDAWCAGFDRPLVWARDKAALQMYAPAAFAKDHRAKPDVEQVYALTFDLDVMPLRTPSEIASAVSGHACSIHTSFRHSLEVPRCRLHVRPSRPLVGWREQALVWRAIAEGLADAGIGVGAEAKDASRASFVAAHAPGTPYEHITVQGEPVDVDGIIAAAREQEETEKREREARRRYYAARKPKTKDRPAERALACAVSAVRSASARHTTLNSEAWSVSRFVVTGELTAHVVRDALIRAGIESGLSEHEATRTVDGGMRARKTA